MLSILCFQYCDSCESQSKQCLTLGPKFMLTPKLNVEDFEVEVELDCVKQRMELWKREEATDEDGILIDEDLEVTEREWKKSRDL